MDITNACSYDLTSLSIDCDVKPQIGIDSVVLCNVNDILVQQSTFCQRSHISC